VTSQQAFAQLDLTDRHVLITGATGTIGRAIARRLHHAGAYVSLHHSGFASGAERAENLAAELGSRCAIVSGDVERDAADICSTAIDRVGPITDLINNAASQLVADFLDIGEDAASEMLRVNVGGPIALTRHAAQRMRTGSSIVNIASIEGMQPARGHSHYSASKAALLMHTRAAAGELGAHGIRVNAVSPGLIRAEGIENAWPEGVARWTTNCPLGRMGEPDDVADAVLFLVSPLARWITGANLVVDGGVLSANTW
jgi:NAD(P)-dependent dehydrogenase (short-subunit alcohol dehydrogenase family)